MTRADSAQPRDGSDLTRPAGLDLDHWGYRHAYRIHFAVRDLSLSIPAGQRVLLLGASGIGKSTILEGIAGILGDQEGALRAQKADIPGDQPIEVEDADGGVTRGRILVDGQPAGGVGGRVGLVLQDPDSQAIFQRLGDNVAFGPENMGVPREEIWRRVEESLCAVGLQDLQLTRSTMHISGGQMQRLALAGALAMEPGLLLLDEPTANLDPDGVHQIVGAVRRVLDRRHSTMILVEHRAQPWMEMIDRVIVLGLGPVEGQEGRPEGDGFRRTVVMADGTPEQVFSDRSLDLAALGIWVPDPYKGPGDQVDRISSRPRLGEDPGSTAGDPILETVDLAVGRDGRAIASGINLAFHAGEVTALVGANGAGKSTLSMTLAGLMEPVSGRVVASAELVGGDGPDQPMADGSAPSAWKSTDLASRISYVFQNPEHQFARGSVLEEVMVAPLRTGATEEEARERARSLLKRFNLNQYASANPYTLSGGEKRRLTVAAALAAAPRVLILDEPTFGQDRVTWTSMAQLIDSLRADGICIIVVTHDMDLVKALGARVVRLVPGESVGGSSQATVCASARREVGQTPVTAAAQAKTAPEGGRDVPDTVVLPVAAMNQRDEPPRMSSRSAYIASINPAFRLLGAFLTALPLLISLDWVSATVALGLELILLMAAGFTPWRIVRSAWPIFLGAPGSALAIILYGKAGGATYWTWGMVHVTQRSVDLALATALRILAIGIPAIITVLGIDATDLADAFSQVLHLPERFVYGGLAGLRLFSVLRDDWTALAASRRSRGLGDENRFKAFFPQAFALLVLSIRRSTTLATAMEARGFGGRVERTHARISKVSLRDWCYLSICLAVPVVALTVAGLTGAISYFGN